MKSELLQIDNRLYTVYKHTTPSNKVYIGITAQGVENRWKGGHGYISQSYFFRAIVKYGWINIKHEILYEGLSLKDAYEKEKELIKLYKATDPNFGYNISEGGDSFRGEEVNKAISKGRNYGKEPKIFIPKGYLGKPVIKYDYSDNVVDIFNTVAMAAYDVKMNKETFRYRLDNFGIYKTTNYYYKYKDPNKTRLRPVLMYDMDGNFLAEFDTQADAERVTGINNKNINAVCRGKKHSAGRKLWRYKDESTDYKSAK